MGKLISYTPPLLCFLFHGHPLFSVSYFMAPTLFCFLFNGLPLFPVSYFMGTPSFHISWTPPFPVAFHVTLEEPTYFLTRYLRAIRAYSLLYTVSDRPLLHQGIVYCIYGWQILISFVNSSILYINVVSNHGIGINVVSNHGIVYANYCSYRTNYYTHKAHEYIIQKQL